jgi:tetratricopeptide (TPR) repeat protein
MSRDRMLMIKTYVGNGERYLQNGGLSGRMRSAMENFHRAEDIAREEKLDEGLVYSNCALSRAYRIQGDNDRALGYSNQAVVLAEEVGDDSLKVLAYASLGSTYKSRNEKLSAFRNYLKALDVAEQSKRNQLIRDVSEYLSDFYRSIHATDKAIDYALRTVELDRTMHHFDGLAGDYNQVGNLFSDKKEYDIALEAFEHEVALGDSIHYDLVNIEAYFNIFNLYLNSQQYAKGIAYLNIYPFVQDYIDRAGLRYFIDQCYADAYLRMGRLDSAGFYFNKAERQADSKGSPYAKASLYDDLGHFYREKLDWQEATRYYLKEESIGQAIGNLPLTENAAQSLDTLYWRMHHYEQAYAYHVEYIRNADSLRSLAREADLLKLEVDNDNKRRDREAREEELAREHRHNIQYMGFTVGLVVLFIVLVMMGWLAVPPSVIRTLGFLSFIFLFEFIILLADKQIQGWTHEEPWKVLLIKIGLAAILVPLHHWLEHKVIVYLSNRKRFKAEHQGKGVTPAHGAQGAVGH